jgi:hypothetical protein
MRRLLSREISCRDMLLAAMSCIHGVLTALPMWVYVRSYDSFSISFPSGGWQLPEIGNDFK